MNFFKRNKKLLWNKLNSDEKKKVSSELIKKVKALARYKVVSGFDQFQREQGQIEVKNEDQILTAYNRGRLLNLVRNQCRNSSTTNTILRQLQENVIGTKGGKAIIDFPNSELTKKVKNLFANYTRSVDFFDGYNLNTVLRLILNEDVIGGDCVILFDKNMIDSSGKILIYESDEIVNTDQDSIKRHYGENATQSNGKVYNGNGRWIGTVVSRSERGALQADSNKCYFLKRDPDGNVLDSLWIQPSNVWRANQGRGITPFASSIGAVCDLEDLTNFELQASKKNAQTFAQIINTNNKEDENAPSAFDLDTDFSNMTDDEIKEALKLQEQTQQENVSLTAAKSCGILFDQMPDGYKMELLNQEHPNATNVIEFVKWLCVRSSAALGLSEVFATMIPDGNTFRAQQLLTQPTFNYYQKRLEYILDWLLVRFLDWKDFKGEFDKKELPENWLSYIAWDFPKLDDLDEVAHQNAIQLQLQNLTATYKDILGINWKEKLLQSAREIKWLKENGLPLPSYNMVSGGEKQGVDIITTEIKEI